MAELRVGCDQVATPKVFTDASGREVKYVDYDSFGVALEDTYPELFIPVGFAGGLRDPDTGLVRFGYRDYDPEAGRFTCPDPLGDTGGDHDLYDYCVDDPVSMNDPAGLIPPVLLFGLGMLGAGAIAGGGTLAAGAIAEGANKAMGDEKNAGKAWEGAKGIVKEQIPQAIAAGLLAGVPLAPGAAKTAAEAYTHLGQKAGAAIQASKHGERIIQGAQFVEGALNPNVSAAHSIAGAMGGVASYAKRLYDQNKK
ncbi:MAG: RHS repeat-associated core domain-containing protein [Deltaproteobacteria bacterium]|nr:RHS repeat-associated core domain-containing protein [Deltaproteobacteria bacterium]